MTPSAERLNEALACATVPHPHQFLRELLELRNEHPERADEIDKKIRATFECERAPFVLDMSGFSRMVIKYGIIHYLAMIRQMVSIASPAILENGGAIVKQEADNIFAIFPDPTSAIRAARDLNKRIGAANIVLPDERDIHVSIGIGFGNILLIPGEDYYGNELNLASKLGEDIAEKKEVLLTKAARDAVTDASITFDEIKASISGVDMTYYKVKE